MITLLTAVQVSNTTIASTTVSYNPLEIAAYETQETTSSGVENVNFIKFVTVDAAASGGAVPVCSSASPVASSSITLTTKTAGTS
jgi:hypothetical protein